MTICHNGGMSEQKLREALERVAGMEDIEPCLACGSHHDLLHAEGEGDPSCYVRQALSLQPPTSDEGTPLTDAATRNDSDGTGYCRGCGTTIGEAHHNDCSLTELGGHPHDNSPADLAARLRESSESVGGWPIMEEAARALESLRALPSGYVQVPEQLQQAHKAIWAMAEDGWLLFGPEGMSESQKLVSDYTLRYQKDALAATPTPSDSKPGEGT